MIHLATKGILTILQPRAPITPGACEVDVLVSGNPDEEVSVESPLEVSIGTPTVDVGIDVLVPPAVQVIVENPDTDVETEC